MPPRLPDAPLCARVGQCVHHTRSPYFSTSSVGKAQIPPTSPKFIEIPRPKQPQQPFPIIVKGVLPIPRPIFPRNPKPGDTNKASAEYLADVTPEPLVDKASSISTLDPRTAEFVSWKARQAEARRRNLRQSLLELSSRKQQKDRFVAARSAKKQAIRKALLEAPEREDERLTNPSVLQSEIPQRHHALPDPNREARLARKRQNVANMEAMRVEHRRAALHNLYVNAGSFITTASQLNATIDKAFDDNSQFTNDSTPGLNIWNLGFPETVQQLLGKDEGRQGTKAMDSAEGNAGVSRERLRRIAEELTGGKLDNSR